MDGLRIALVPNVASRFLAGCALFLVFSCAALAQTATSKPTWNDLTPQQREALAPLAADWAKFDGDRKRKWLEVAAKYPNLSPEGKQRVHQRMGEFSKLTHEQKKTARENFIRAYELPADQRQATVQKFQELPEDKKRELADRAAAKKAEPKPPPPRRATRDLDVPPAKPPAQTEKVGS